MQTTPTSATPSGIHGVARASGALLGLYALTFFTGALLHAGVRIPLGFAVLDEPRIPPAVVVESLCGLALGVAAVAVLTRRAWAWLAALTAQAFALAGVLLGMVAIAAGRGPRSALNDTYHQVMATLLLAGLVFVSTPVGRAALGRRSTRSPSVEAHR